MEQTCELLTDLKQKTMLHSSKKYLKDTIKRRKATEFTPMSSRSAISNLETCKVSDLHKKKGGTATATIKTKRLIEELEDNEFKPINFST